MRTSHQIISPKMKTSFKDKKAPQLYWFPFIYYYRRYSHSHSFSSSHSQMKACFCVSIFCACFQVNREREEDETTHLSRCSFSAFSTSVYSKDDALFYCNSHIDKVTENERKGNFFFFIFFPLSLISPLLIIKKWLQQLDKITIYHSHNLNSLHSVSVFADALTHFFHFVFFCLFFFHLSL